jgi:hypothetical protein
MEMSDKLIVQIHVEFNDVELGFSAASLSLDSSDSALQRSLQTPTLLE